MCVCVCARVLVCVCNLDDLMSYRQIFGWEFLMSFYVSVFIIVVYSLGSRAIPLEYNILGVLNVNMNDKLLYSVNCHYYFMWVYIYTIILVGTISYNNVVLVICVHIYTNKLMHSLTDSIKYHAVNM